MTPRPLPDLIADSRVFAAREAIIATLARLLPDVRITPHPGKLDLSDIVEGEVYTAPSIAVAAARIHADLGTPAGQMATPVDWAAYVVAEDRALGAPAQVYTRDEIALALCQALTQLLHDPAARECRWGVADISCPETIDARPLFTAKSWKSGQVFWVVTWRQTIYSDAPLWDMDGVVDALQPPPPLLLPGDAGYPTGGAP